MAGGNRFRYGQWRGGPDPLAPPYDVRAAVDAVGSDVLAGGSLRESLRELLRRGPQGRGGLDDLAARARRLRREALRRGDLDGAVTRARALLDQALAAERDELRGRDGDDARFAEAVLDNLPRSTARAVSELSGYDWASAEARQTYQRILDGLRGDVLEQRFAGLRDAARAAADPAAQRQLAEMMRDLNDLLARHARSEDTTDAFAEFMGRHGEFFPERPRNVDELIDVLARRAAAGERLMRSLSDRQREELAGLMRQSLGDRLAGELSQLDAHLRSLRPDLNWAARRGAYAATSRSATARPPARSTRSPNSTNCWTPSTRTSPAPRSTTSTWRRSPARWAATPPTTYAGCRNWNANCAARAGSPATRTG